MDRDTAMKEFEDLVEKAKQMPVEDKHFMYKGIPYPSIVTSLETLQALDNFEARADDILLVSYPKCGFNWMLHIVNSLAITAGTTKKGNEILPPLLEFRKPEKLQVLSSTPSQRILGTHLHPDNLPNSFFEKKAKILTMIRNPKDAAVSFYHFLHSPFIGFNYTWDEFFSIFMEGKAFYGSYFDYISAWNKKVNDENVLVVIYEELKKNMSEEIKKIAKFLNFTLTDEQIQSICSMSTFKSMKENSMNTHGEMGNILFRKGDIGDWKNCLTEEQSKAVDDKFEKHLAGTKIGDLLKYDEYCK
ncbi:sulfotransferase 6B1-like isoform X7 [Erpetoichthys calabaricus]|uniref:sulfotransferase 6B1-like isoform X7 n=1 Tax=Erpetoichthys calabaricus TaxID=27687 RepID=UPI0022344B3D|nr:sulfotransferase 6B1-like isoform X7 [Erpetoichthys calabaricus]